MRVERKISQAERRQLKETTTTVEKEKVDCSYSEYRIGLTTYRVKINFNSDTDESLEDVINRLIAREIEKTA
ncbi:MAG: hypothetical protein ACI4GX_06640 [Ruminococcus sp.]